MTEQNINLNGESDKKPKIVKIIDECWNIPEGEFRRLRNVLQDEQGVIRTLRYGYETPIYEQCINNEWLEINSSELPEVVKRHINVRFPPAPEMSNSNEVTEISFKLKSLQNELDSVISLNMVCGWAVENTNSSSERIAEVIDMAVCKVFDIREEINNLIESA